VVRLLSFGCVGKNSGIESLYHSSFGVRKCLLGYMMVLLDFTFCLSA